ncbi:MAG: hypothetical protein HXY20_01750 [Acidobacteria bacterium]|nr:hypothetical protein [Acidobacteriota bacterium]
MANLSAEVTTTCAEAVGLTGMMVNGSINARGLHTTYYFEYGPDPSYGRRTVQCELPSGARAYFSEGWDKGLGAWGSWLTAEHHSAKGKSPGFNRFSEPSEVDDNHEDGIGSVHLVKYLLCGPVAPPGYSTVVLGGGDPDFRGARISYWVRGINWQPHGSELLFWAQSQRNIQIQYGPGWRRANWAYTGMPLTDYLLDGRWHRVEYELRNDTSFWSYAGNNPTGQGKSAERYEFWPLEDSLRHLNWDFFHLLAFIDRESPPTGAIDFDEFELSYPNKSLLVPGNGGLLIGWPADSEDDPRALTDGWRCGAAHSWKSRLNPSGHQEFVYSFRDPVTVQTIQLHQHEQWPTREAEIQVSADDRVFRTIACCSLPRVEEAGPNQAFGFVSGLSEPARYLKLILKSGYTTERLGLGEIEVFGTGAMLLPADCQSYVNACISGLNPGNTYHYRLVARNEAGISYGEDRAFTTPAAHNPLVFTLGPRRVGSRSAAVEARINALGLPTQVYFEYAPLGRPKRSSRPRYAGLQMTPRNALANLGDLEPGTTYLYRAVAANASGVSVGEERAFTTDK